MEGSMTTSTIFFFMTFLLSSIHYGPLFAGAIGDTVMLKLVHRHSPHFKGGIGLINKTGIDIIRELHHLDMIRHQRLFRSRDHHETPRRKVVQTVSMAMALKSGFDLGSGLYWVQVTIGTPPRTFMLAADTASDLTWVKCKYNTMLNEKDKEIERQHLLRMKKNHHPDKRPSHIFNKRVFRADLSTTFKTIPCSDRFCSLGLGHMMSYDYCPTPSSPCRYKYQYMGGDLAEGLFGNETVRVPLANGTKLQLHDVIVGCSVNHYQINQVQGDGILGLGFGSYSFAETVVSSKFAGKFSYCLMNYMSHAHVSSYLTFGENNQTVNSTMKTTELVMMGNNKEDELGFYCVKVTGMSIGGVMLDIPSEVWDLKRPDGGVIIDSGSTSTFLALPAYKAVMAALAKALTKYQRVVIDGVPFEFCFKSKGFDQSLVPKLALHFADGGKFEPPVENYVPSVDSTHKCIGFVLGAPGERSILGNQMQQNHLWEYDILRGTVGFAHSSCT